MKLKRQRISCDKRKKKLEEHKVIAVENSKKTNEKPTTTPTTKNQASPQQVNICLGRTLSLRGKECPVSKEIPRKCACRGLEKYHSFSQRSHVRILTNNIA